MATTPLADLIPPAHLVLERRVCTGQALVKGAGACRARAGRPACLDPRSARVRHTAPRIAGVLSQCLTHKLLDIGCIDGQVPQDLCGRVQAPEQQGGTDTHTQSAAARAVHQPRSAPPAALAPDCRGGKGQREGLHARVKEPCASCPHVAEDTGSSGPQGQQASSVGESATSPQLALLVRTAPPIPCRPVGQTPTLVSGAYVPASP